EFGMGSGGTTALLPPDKFCLFPFSFLFTKPKHQSQTSCVSFTFRLLTHYQKQPNLSKTPSVLSG
ncbi:hypothetical protein ABN078_21270, partial [Providencia huaxiensis]|uniref:hypothetical protein n=1 Tax=Providencia huaxiensis TaxID=2027290 RepID=UPI0032D9CD7D